MDSSFDGDVNAENQILKKTVAELKENYSSLQVKYNELVDKMDESLKEHVESKKQLEAMKSKEMEHLGTADEIRHERWTIEESCTKKMETFKEFVASLSKEEIE